MASLPPTSGTVLHDGRILRVTFAAQPDVSGGGGVPDYRPGYREGLALRLDGVACTFLGAMSVTHNTGGMGLETTSNLASTITPGGYYFRIAYFQGAQPVWISAVSAKLDSGSADTSFPVDAEEQMTFRFPFPVPAGMTARLYATLPDGLFEDMYEIARDLPADSSQITLAAFPHDLDEPPPTIRQWTSWWLIPEAQRVAHGISGLTISPPAALLRDAQGNATTAAVDLPLTNLSIVDAQGFSTADFPLSPTGKIVHVSETHGDDAATGLDINFPKRTINSALGTLPTNSGSRIRLLRGDTFPQPANFTSRRGAEGAGQPPLVIESYWNPAYGADPLDIDPENARPVIDGTAFGFNFASWPLTAGTPTQYGSIIWRGIHLIQCRLSTTTWGTLLACVDCILENTGFYPDGGYARPGDDAVLIRCVVHDTRFPDGDTGLGNSGVHTHYTRRVLLSECLVWQCGINGGAKSIYNHNLYLQSWTNEALVWGSWIGRASSHGFQMRGGGCVAYTIFWRNCQAGFVGGRGGTIRRCVNLQSEDLDASGRGMGFGLASGSAGVPQALLLDETIIANTLGTQPYGVELDFSDNEDRVRAPAHVIVRNVTAFNTGRALRLIGDRPVGSLAVHNCILAGDPADSSERDVLHIDLMHHDADDIAAWATINHNVYAMPQAAAKPIRKKIAAGALINLSIAEWQAEGHDADSIDRGAVVPPLVSPAYTVATYAAANGLIDEDGLIAAAKARPPGTWPDWLRVPEGAWIAFRDAYTATDLPAQDALDPFGFYGAGNYIAGEPPPTTTLLPEPTTATRPFGEATLTASPATDGGPTVLRAALEKILVDRAGPYMLKAGLAVTFDGANADLDDPLRSAWKAAGFDLAGATTVTDALLTGITELAYDEVIDRAEYALFKKIQTRRKTTSVQIPGAIQTYDSDLLRQINAILARMRADIEATWGPPQTGAAGGIVFTHDPSAATLLDYAE